MEFGTSTLSHLTYKFMTMVHIVGFEVQCWFGYAYLCNNLGALYYTKFCIQCHMVVYVIVVTFMMTLMNKFTEIGMDD